MVGVSPAEVVKMWVEVDKTIMCTAKNAVQSMHTKNGCLINGYISCCLVDFIHSEFCETATNAYFLTILRHSEVSLQSLLSEIQHLYQL